MIGTTLPQKFEEFLKHRPNLRAVTMSRLMLFAASSVARVAEYVSEYPWFSQNLPKALRSLAYGHVSQDLFRSVLKNAENEWRFAVGRYRRFETEVSWRRNDMHRQHLQMLVLGMCQPLNIFLKKWHLPGCLAAYRTGSQAISYAMQLSWDACKHHSQAKSPGDDRPKPWDIQCSLGTLYDIFHVSPPVPPQVMAWNNGTVPRMAEEIFLKQDHAAMPVLADAAEEAGLEDQDLLQHLRGPAWGQCHWVGCWGVDALRDRVRVPELNTPYLESSFDPPVPTFYPGSDGEVDLTIESEEIF